MSSTIYQAEMVPGAQARGVGRRWMGGLGLAVVLGGALAGVAAVNSIEKPAISGPVVNQDLVMIEGVQGYQMVPRPAAIQESHVATAPRETGFWWEGPQGYQYVERGVALPVVHVAPVAVLPALASPRGIVAETDQGYEFILLEPDGYVVEGLQGYEWRPRSPR